MACTAPGDSEVYAAPWAAGEPVSLAMRTPAMLEEAENPSPLLARGGGVRGGQGRKKKRSPSSLLRPEKTELELEHQPGQAGRPLRSQGASCLCDLPFPVWPPREEQ